MVSTLVLLSDFGLVVLIWMVQLIIYPSFLVIEEDAFKVWHKKYMLLISYLVIPLMFAQVAFHALALLNHVSIVQGVAALLMGVAWATTFGYSVPRHNALANSGKSSATALLSEWCSLRLRRSPRPTPRCSSLGNLASARNSLPAPFTPPAHGPMDRW